MALAVLIVGGGRALSARAAIPAMMDEQPSGNIAFADGAVKALCVANWDTDGDGELSYEEAAAVTELGEVFWNNEEMTSFDELQFFTGLTSIDESAFQFCSNLTSVTFPNTVSTIGNAAFWWCQKLSNVILSNSLTNIGTNTFYACFSLSDIVIPNSVTTIGASAFSDCESLVSIDIPSSVTSIGQAAFDCCLNLTSMTVAAGNTFYDSRDNCNAIIETATNTLIAGCVNTIIPNTVTSIGNEAFSRNYSLTSIDIPTSVTTIGDYAFSGCISLTNIDVPSSVTTIGPGAFSSCWGLTKMSVDSGNNKYDSRGDCNAIIETESNTLIAGCVNTTIPNTVTTIGFGAFEFCN